MVRSRRILEVIESDGLVERAATLGRGLLARLHELASRHEIITEVRGRGLMCAFTLPDATTRDRVLDELRVTEHVLALGCGNRSIRFRPALTIGEAELGHGIDAIERVLVRLG